MTVGLLFLMGYHLWGRAIHGWLGIAVLMLYIAHHVLNRNWHKSLFKGKYNAIRSLTLAVDALVFVSMLFQMFSAVAISRHVFAFLPHIGHMAFFRRLHMLGAYITAQNFCERAGAEKRKKNDIYKAACRKVSCFFAKKYTAKRCACGGML